MEASSQVALSLCSVLGFVLALMETNKEETNKKRTGTTHKIDGIFDWAFNEWIYVTASLGEKAWSFLVLHFADITTPSFRFCFYIYYGSVYPYST